MLDRGMDVPAAEMWSSYLLQGMMADIEEDEGQMEMEMEMEMMAQMEMDMGC